MISFVENQIQILKRIKRIENKHEINKLIKKELKLLDSFKNKLVMQHKLFDLSKDAIKHD
jgi:hypothetical protein